MRLWQSLAAAALAAGAAPAFAQEPMPDAQSACGESFSAPVRLTEYGGERLSVTFEGPDCLTAGVLWRVYDVGGTVIWAHVSQYRDLTGVDQPLYEPGSMDEVLTIYRGKTEEPRQIEAGALPAWGDSDYGAPLAFEFEWEGVYAVSADGVDRRMWERARESRRPTLCLVPGTHQADCYWLDEWDHRLKPLFHLSWL